jgi:hypothetical protein
VVSVGSFGNMLEYCSLKDCAVLDALAHKPWKIDCSVDADGGKFLGIVNTGA